ncbi:hypothetical protein L3V82_09270 [Thiotrichales bacterium 19S3-7]|nr:hypothetical protein [Thiotrichales bacterium 19S3-7]MCF6802384.1 hypothetical protein [Thiotrichales bacterium 19S3-11]
MTFFVFQCPINEYRGTLPALLNKTNSFQIATQTFNQLNKIENEKTRTHFLNAYDSFDEAKKNAKTGEKYTYQDIILEADINQQSQLKTQNIQSIYYFSNQAQWTQIITPKIDSEYKIPNSLFSEKDSTSNANIKNEISL